jgi:hypothetical protein
MLLPPGIPLLREREKHRNHKPSQSEALRGKESGKRKTERERREQNLIPCSRWTQKRRQEWQRWKTFLSDYIRWMIFVDKSEAKGRRKSSFSCAAQNEERFRRSESERLSGFFFDGRTF